MQRQSRCWTREIGEQTNGSEIMNCVYDLPPTAAGLIYTGFSNFHEIENGTFNLTWNREPDEGHLLDAPAFSTMFLIPTPRAGTGGRYPEDMYENFQAPFLSDKAGVIPSSLTISALIKLTPQKDMMHLGYIDSAHICALSLCANDYSVTVNSGFSNSTVLSTTYSTLSILLPKVSGLGALSSSYTFLSDFNDFTFTPGITRASSVVQPAPFELGFSMNIQQILGGNASFN